jgi:hypothetical protein
MFYPHGMGTVIRCAGCDNALMRVAHQVGTPGWYLLDLKGLRYLWIEEA